MNQQHELQSSRGLILIFGFILFWVAPTLADDSSSTKPNKEEKAPAPFEERLKEALSKLDAAKKRIIDQNAKPIMDFAGSASTTDFKRFFDNVSVLDGINPQAALAASQAYKGAAADPRSSSDGQTIDATIVNDLTNLDIKAKDRGIRTEYANLYNQFFPPSDLGGHRSTLPLDVTKAASQLAAAASSAQSYFNEAEKLLKPLVDEKEKQSQSSTPDKEDYSRSNRNFPFGGEFGESRRKKEEGSKEENAASNGNGAPSSSATEPSAAPSTAPLAAARAEETQANFHPATGSAPGPDSSANESDTNSSSLIAGTRARGAPGGRWLPPTLTPAEAPKSTGAYNYSGGKSSLGSLISNLTGGSTSAGADTSSQNSQSQKQTNGSAGKSAYEKYGRNQNSNPLQENTDNDLVFKLPGPPPEEAPFNFDRATKYGTPLGGFAQDTATATRNSDGLTSSRKKRQGKPLFRTSAAREQVDQSPPRDPVTGHPWLLSNVGWLVRKCRDGLNAAICHAAHSNPLRSTASVSQ